MDVEGLLTFLTVRREGGFSAAARRLGRTQPAISHRIRLLERALGVPLFERTAAGMVLSQAGRVLEPYAEHTLATLADAKAAVHSLVSEASGPVSIAVVGTLAGAPLSDVLRRFARAHPGVDLRLCTARSAEVSNLVRTGDATLGLRYEHDRSPDLSCTTLAMDPLVVVCAPDHRLAGRKLADLRSLARERWIAFPEIPGQREIAAAHVFGLFASRGLGEVDWMAVDSLTAQKRLVEAGFGLALMPSRNVAEELDAGALARIRIQDLDAAMNIVAVVRKDGFLSPAARRVLELLRDGLAPLASGPRQRRSRDR